MAVVYQHRRKDTNDVFYIGIGKDKYRPYQKVNRNKYWNNIVDKVGYEVDILIEGVSYEEACKIEEDLIKSYGRKDLGTGNLVNMKEGGKNGIGWNHSKETIEKISKSQIGKVGAWKGKKHSEESKVKMRKPKPEGFQKGRSITWHTGKEPKKVIQLDLEGKQLRIWDSVKQIKEELNIKVYDTLEGRNRTAGGFIWIWYTKQCPDDRKYENGTISSEFRN